MRLPPQFQAHLERYRRKYLLTATGAALALAVSLVPRLLFQEPEVVFKEPPPRPRRASTQAPAGAPATGGNPEVSQGQQEPMPTQQEASRAGGATPAERTAALERSLDQEPTSIETHTGAPLHVTVREDQLAAPKAAPSVAVTVHEGDVTDPKVSAVTQFETFKTELHSHFHAYVKQKFPALAISTLVPPRWVARPKGRQAVEAHFRGQLRVGPREFVHVDGVAALLPKGWVVVDGEFPTRVKLDKDAEWKRQYEAWGTENDWQQFFKEWEPALKKLTRRVQAFNTKHALSKREIARLVLRWKKGDASVASALAETIHDAKNTYREEIIKRLATVDRVETLYELRGFIGSAHEGDRLAKNAFFAIGQSRREEAFRILLEFLQGKEEWRALEAARFIAKFGDPRALESLAYWAVNTRSEPNRRFYVDAIGDISQPQTFAVVDQLYGVFAKAFISKEREAMLRSLIRTMYVLNPEATLPTMRKSFAMVTERLQAYYLEKFLECDDRQALPQARLVLEKQGYDDLFAFIEAKKAAIRFVARFGDRTDLARLDDVLKNTEGDYGKGIREAILEARKAFEGPQPASLPRER